MRILYTLVNTSPTGGSSKSFLSMIKEILKYGHEIAVICPDDKGISVKLREKGVKVFSVPYRPKILPSYNRGVDVVKWIPRFFSNLLINRKSLPKLIQIAKDFNPDIIHENNSVTGMGYELAKRIKKPLIIHIREYGYKDFRMILPGITKRLNANFVWTISITEGIYKYRKQDKRRQSFQIYNGIISEAERYYNPQKEDFFFFAGSLFGSKGVEDLIEAYLAYAHFVKNPFELILAGPVLDLQLIENLKKRIEDNNLSGKVKWLGAIDNVKDYYREAAATIIPSKFEGLGRVMPEAMINGSLCIGRNTGGTKEQLDKGHEICGKEIGIRFENVEELTSRLIEVHNKKSTGFEDGGKYEKMIKLSQVAAIENFSIEKYGIKINSVYETICNKMNI